MDEKEELAYVQGSRAAWRSVLSEALVQLGRDSEEWTEKRWLVEREAAIAVLRDLCSHFGDNDWDDSLHLGDIIDKHLGRHLHTR